MAKVQTRIYADEDDLKYLSAEAAKRRTSRSQLIATIIGEHVDWLRSPSDLSVDRWPTADDTAPPDPSNPDA